MYQTGTWKETEGTFSWNFEKNLITVLLKEVWARLREPTRDVEDIQWEAIISQKEAR